MKKPSPIKRALQPLQQFLKLEAASGIVLLAATVLAMIVANSSLAGSYQALLEIPFTVKLGEFGLSKSLWHWINDGLMAIFFFVVGLELKREMVEGHLSSFRRAALPAFAAAGGMAALLDYCVRPGLVARRTESISRHSSGTLFPDRCTAVVCRS